MQRLRHGPLVDLAPKVELWLDGGHNPAGGEAVAATLARMPARDTHLICGMLNTKDVKGYMTPLAPHVQRLHAVSIPGEKNTLPAEVTRDAALSAGIDAVTAASVAEALAGYRRNLAGSARADLRLALPRRIGAARERLSCGASMTRSRRRFLPMRRGRTRGI